MTNRLIGGWAVIDRDFATYTGAGSGVTPLQNAGAAGYDRINYTDATTNGINSALSGENIRMVGTGTAAAGHSVTLSGNKTMNALAYIPQNTAGTAAFNLNGNTLTLQSGGLSLSPNASSDTAISLSVTNGFITAGTPGVGGELFIHHLPFPGTDNAERHSINLGATITDNAGGAVALVLNSQNHNGGTARRSTLYITGDNEHTGGTFVNSGRIVLNTAGANGSSVVAIPGDLTIIGGFQQQSNGFDGNNLGQLGEVFAYSTGQIATTSNVTLKGTSRLDFGGAPSGITASVNTTIGATIASLTFDNTGGQAPVVSLGNGNLVINGAITAGGTNVGSNTISTISRTGTGVIDFAGAASTINVTAITVDGAAVNDLLPNLNINVPITNTPGLTKTGNGILQLSAASTFNGNLNLNAGGILVGASSTTSARPIPSIAPVVTSGPLGTGTLNIANGTSLLSSAANTVGNAVNVNGNFTVNGTNNLTLNGDVNLGGATRSIAVPYFQTTATLGGVVSNGGITKTGNGTLFLNNNNTYTGGTTLTAGTLVGQIPGGGAPNVSPFGTGSIAYNGGYLSMRTQTGDAIFGNDINVNSSLSYVYFDVQGGSQITMGNLNLPMTAITGAGTAGVTGGPTATLVNVGGTLGSTLRFPTTTLAGNGDGGSALVRTAGQFQTFNVSSGVTTILSSVFSRNNEPLNVGAGNLLLGGANLFPNATTITTSGLGAAPLANATTAIYGAGQTVTLSGGTVGTPIVYSILPQTNTVIGGSSTGGLEQTAINVSSGSLNAAAVWGNGATSIFNGDLPNDAAFDRVLHTNAAISTLGVYNGYINITTAGDYKFLMGSDDFSSLVIDGVEVGRDITTGHGVNDTARGGLFLTAGQHSITYKINTGTGTAGGGGRLLYSGPDTVASGTNGGWQAISGTRLSYFTGPANAGNNFYNAAQIDNDYSLAAASVFTLQGLGTDYNTTVKSLTMGAGSQLNVTNDLGTAGVGGSGFIGVKGVTTVTAGTAVLNPTSANLYLIGGINDGGAGLTKASTSTGTLSLNNSTLFTGAFAINGGTVVLRETNALSTGSNTVASGASIDLYGVGSSAGRVITLNGTGTASQIGAIYNSQATAASVAGNVTLNANSQIAGYGEISLDGTVTSGAGVTLTKAGSNTLTLTVSNTGTLLGPVTVAGGILNNGALNSGVSGALGAGAITVNAGAVLNLAGNNLAQNLTTNGTSIANAGPNGNTLGTLINSSISNSVSVRNAVTAGNNMMQLANTANTVTISGNIAMNTGTLGIGSNTFATGGDIIVSGIMSGTQFPTKVGGNTLTLRGVNTFANGPTINYGTLKLDNGGVFNGTGGAVTIQAGGSFILDNTGTLTQNRINNGVAANNRNISLNGGTFSILGNSAATALTETASASVTGGNTSGILINQGMNNINLTVASPTAGAITLTATRAGTNADFQNASGGTVLITGRRLGLDAVGTAGSTSLVLTNGATTGVGLVMVGQNSNTALGGAAAATNKGLAAYALVDDGTVVDFATIGSAATGIRAISSGTGNAAERTAAAATLATTANLNSSFALASAATVNSATSPNSIKFTTGGSLTLGQGTTLNVQSGGILATANATISGPGVIGAEGTNNASGTAAAQNLYVWTHGASTTLTVNASLGSLQSNTGRTNELIKAGAGTLVLGGANFLTTNTRVQEGTLTLNNASAIYYRPTTPGNFNAFVSSNVGPTLQVNGGATLNMNGFDLPVNNLSSINPAGTNQGSLSGGTITNAGTNKNLTVNSTTNNTWSGVIAGDINFNKYGRDTFTITNSNTFDGTTIIAGGATTLTDLGAFRGTSGVTINAATLIWNDNTSQSDAYRLGATPASVTLNGGGFQYNGRSGESSVANLGAVTLNGGASAFATNAATLGSATVQMTGFTRTGNGTINFSGSTLGDDGIVIVTGTAPTNNNGIVGGWAITTSANPYLVTGAGDFVTYDPVTGFRAIVDYKTTGGLTYASGNANQPAFGAAAFGAGNNIRVNNNTTMNAGTNVVNSMVIGINATTTLTFGAPTDTLFVQSGGILGSTDNNAKNIGGATAPTAANLNGYITAGNSNGSAGAGNAGYELFLHNTGNTLIVNSQIVDNGANPVTLIASSGSVASPAIRLNNTNTFTGSMIVQSVDLKLNSSFAPAIANSLDIRILGGTNAATDSSSQANNRIQFEQNNQLNSAANLLIANGSANLDLNNFNQTLNNITFNNIGGHTGTSSGMGPHIRTGVGVLTLTGGVTATNLANTSTVPFIMGIMSLPSGQHTFQVDPLTYAPNQVGLGLLGVVTGAGGIDKTGTGILAITAISNYTGPTNVNNGTLVLGGVAQDGATDSSAAIASSRVTVASGATVDLRGGNALIGSLAGAGTVTNSVYAMINNTSNGNVGQLTIGADNTNGANFSGVFTNFINGANETTGFGLNVNKIGTGNQIISGDNAASISSAAVNGDMNNVGTLDIQDGTITVNGANGSLGFTTINIRPGATLTLDNSANVKANRLGGFRLTDSANGDTANDTTTGRAINVAGGILNFNAGSALMNEGTSATLAMGTNNGIGTVTLVTGNSTWNFNGGTNNGVTVNAAAFTAGSGSLQLNAGATQSLGRAAAGTNSINVYVNGGMVAPQLQGSGSLSTGAPVATAAGLVGGNFSGIGIRPDITGTDSTGSGFVTYDRFGYRLLTSSEYSAFPVQPNSPLTNGATGSAINPAAAWANPNLTSANSLTGTSAAAASGAAGPTTITLSVANAANVNIGQYLSGTGVPGGVRVTAVNYATGVVTVTPYTTIAAVAANQAFTYNNIPNVIITEGQSFTTGNTVASIRLDNGGGLTSMGGSNGTASNYNALGALNTTTASSGLILANSGNTGLNGGAISAGGSALRLSVDSGATLNADTFLISTAVGTALIKEGSGILNLNKQVYLGSATDAGQLVVNGGTVNLSSGPNTLTVVNSAGVSITDNLNINPGSTVDMMGFSQTIATLNSNDVTPGGGGTLTNSGSAANLYLNANGTFGGAITGGINLYKTGTNNQALTSASTYTGTTTVQGGILILQDSGTLASTTYNLYGGQLRYDNRAPTLSEIVNRAPTSSTINMRSGTFLDLARTTSNQVTQSFATVNVDQGVNELRVDTGNEANRTLSIGTLNATNNAQVHFNTGVGTLGQIGVNPNIAFSNFSATTTMINGVIPWAIASGDQPAMYNPVINPLTGVAYGVAVPNQTTNAAVAITGTNAAAASGAAGPTSITVTPAQAATVAVGTYLTGTGVPAGVLVTAVNTGTGVITVAPWTATAAVTANQAFTYTGGTANYQNTAFTSATTSQNVNLGTGTINEAAITTSRVFNSLRFSSGTATAINMGRSEALRLEAGLIISSGSTLPISNGTITAGTAPNVSQALYANAIANALTINSQIVNNGSGTLTLVKGGASALNLNPQIAGGGSQTGAASNSTVAGSTTLTLSAAPPGFGAAGAASLIGQKVYGPGIPNGTTVTGVSGSTITLSQPALATQNAGTFSFGDAVVSTTNIAAAANGAALPTTFNVPNAQAAALYVGSNVQGVGFPAGINITTIGAADSGGAGFTTITINAGTANAAVVASQSLSFGTGTQISTNNAYTGATIVNQGTLNLNGAVGSRSMGGSTILGINNGGAVAMTNAGQISPATDVTINGGGTLTFTPVTLAEPTSGQINAINSLTFNNNGGTVQPLVAGGTNGIVTVKNGLITSNSDNQGSAALVSGVLNFGQVSLGSWASGASSVTVTDVAGFVTGQTITGTGIAAGTTISSIAGNVLNLSAATTAASAATGSLVSAVNQPSGSTSTMTPTFAVNTTDVNELSADLVVSAVVSNSAAWPATTGASLTKTGTGNLVLSGASTFNNGFALTAGTLTLGASSTPTTGTVTSGPVGTGVLTISGGTTILSDSTTRTIANNVVVSGDFTVGGQQSGNSVILNGTVDLGSSNRNITVTNPTVTATLGGVVSGTGGLTKSGNGTLSLGAANTYTGGTTINGGLVSAGNASALGSNQNDLTVKAGATLNVNGFGLTVDGLNGDSATSGGLITNSGAAATLTIGNNNEPLATFAGTITNGTNALNVVKAGTGTQVLTGVNTYTGTTAVNGGVLQIGTNSSPTATSGTGAITVNSGGTVAGTGRIIAPSAGNTFTVASGGIVAPGDTAGTANGSLSFGSVVGSGLQPQLVTTVAVSPSSATGVVNLTVSNGGQVQLGITTPTLNSGDVVSQLNAGTYTTALSAYTALNASTQQTWNGQGWTQVGVGLVGGNTLTYAGLANAVGLGNSGGNGSIFVGQSVSGIGIPVGTTITAITTGTNPVITLSQSITAAANAITLNGTSVQNVNIVAGLNSITLADATGLSVGNTVTGYGIPANSVIATINGNVITLRDSTTSALVSPLASTTAPVLSFAAPGNHDRLFVSGTLTLGTNAAGTVSVVDNGYLSNAVAGDVFNLLDWSTVTTSGTFTVGSNFRSGGTGGGDLNLPTLSSGLFWDVSAFASQGVLVVVPEPSRALLVLLGLLGLMMRRRRKVA